MNRPVSIATARRELLALWLREQVDAMSDADALAHYAAYRAARDEADRVAQAKPSSPSFRPN